MNGNGYNNENPFEEKNDDYIYQMVTGRGRRKTYGWSVASMVCGIISVICCCTGYAGVIFGILAIVFAIISRKILGYFDGMAIAGLVLGIIGTVLGATLLVATYSIDDADMQKFLDEYMEEYYQQFPEARPDTPDV